MMIDRDDIRLALPSKGRLANASLDLLADAGFRVHKPNPRQYEATISGLPGVSVLFQRAGDIVVSVGDGSVDFGITGWDVVSERMINENNRDSKILPLLKSLEFGDCTLNAIVPEKWESVSQMIDLMAIQEEKGRPLRIATKFPGLTREFFCRNGYDDVRLISAEGTLEIAPSVGYADMIVDLVSTGTTLRDNRLRILKDGLILSSQACLIANHGALKSRSNILAVAKQLLEFIVAYLRADENVAIFANIRCDSPNALAKQILSRPVLGGLQGPTIAPVFTNDGEDWHAVNIIVRKEQLALAISELRKIGGSGVVVTAAKYIFEEEPPAYREMLAALEGVNDTGL